MNDTPTPETDKCVKQNKHLKFLQEYVWVNDNKITYENPIVFLCQKLERERDEWKAKYIQQNKDFGCELRDPNGTIWDHAKTLQRERDEAWGQRDAVTLRLGNTQERMIDAEMQRDAAMQCHEWCRKDRKRIIKELTTVTAQRDRLAEALKRIVTIYENPEKNR
jgi:hypothetical protein